MSGSVFQRWPVKNRDLDLAEALSPWRDFRKRSRAPHVENRTSPYRCPDRPEVQWDQQHNYSVMRPVFLEYY